MSKRKVLLVYGDVGGGHASAARALKEAFALVYGESYEVVAVDLFKVADPAPWGDSNASLKFVSQTAFLRELNTWFNIISDIGLPYYLLKRLILHRTLTPYERFFEQHPAELIVSLHPYTTMTLAALRHKGMKTACAVVLTDLVSFARGWADPDAALTISPTKESSDRLQMFGVSAERITEPLFPLRPSLRHIMPKEELFVRHQLNPSVKTIVVTGGGLATGAQTAAIAQLAQYQLQVIVVCGKDRGIAEKLRSEYAGRPAVVVLEFVQDMQNYLRHADVVLTKAGSLSIAEIELLEVPAIITHEVGSQEKGNAAYALQNPRFRFLAGDMRRLPENLEALLSLPKTGLPPSRRTFEESLEIVRHLASLLE